MNSPVDHQAAARAGVHRQHDEDVRPKYDGDSSLFPKGWDAMDADRHVVECSDNIHVQQMIGSLNRWRAWCGDCSVLRHGWSKAEALAALKEAHK